MIQTTLLSLLKQYSSHLLFLTSTLCAMLFGFFLHGIYFFFLNIPINPPQFIPDMHTPIGTLSILGTFDNHLIVDIGPTDIRLIADKDIFLLEKETTYSLPLHEMSEQEYHTIETLTEKESSCMYVATPKGKTAYLRYSTQGQRIRTPQCFKTKEEAENKGLTIKEE